jgi:hypothetical protein
MEPERRQRGRDREERHRRKCIRKTEGKRQIGRYGEEETEMRDGGRDRGEIYRRRDGGEETEGTDLWEGQRGTCKRGEREKKEGERKGKGRGRVKGREEVDTVEEMQGRGIGRETYKRQRKVTERKQTEGKRHRRDKEEKRQRRRKRGRDRDVSQRAGDRGEERGREKGGREGEGQRGGKGGVREGGREEKKTGRRSGGSCGLHFFKGTVTQDFWSDFLHRTPSLGLTGPKGRWLRTNLNFENHNYSFELENTKKINKYGA